MSSGCPAGEVKFDDIADLCSKSRKSFLKTSRTLHPDKNPDCIELSTSMFKVCEANKFVKKKPVSKPDTNTAKKPMLLKVEPQQSSNTIVKADVKVKDDDSEPDKEDASFLLTEKFEFVRDSNDAKIALDRAQRLSRALARITRMSTVWFPQNDEELKVAKEVNGLKKNRLNECVYIGNALNTKKAGFHKHIITFCAPTKEGCTYKLCYDAFEQSKKIQEAKKNKKKVKNEAYDILKNVFNEKPASVGVSQHLTNEQIIAIENHKFLIDRYNLALSGQNSEIALFGKWLLPTLTRYAKKYLHKSLFWLLKYPLKFLQWCLNHPFIVQLISGVIFFCRLYFCAIQEGKELVNKILDSWLESLPSQSVLFWVVKMLQEVLKCGFDLYTGNWISGMASCLKEAIKSVPRTWELAVNVMVSGATLIFENIPTYFFLGVDVTEGIENFGEFMKRPWGFISYLICGDETGSECNREDAGLRDIVKYINDEMGISSIDTQLGIIKYIVLTWILPKIPGTKLLDWAIELHAQLNNEDPERTKSKFQKWGIYRHFETIGHFIQFLSGEFDLMHKRWQRAKRDISNVIKIIQQILFFIKDILFDLLGCKLKQMLGDWGLVENIEKCSCSSNLAKKINKIVEGQKWDKENSFKNGTFDNVKGWTLSGVAGAVTGAAVGAVAGAGALAVAGPAALGSAGLWTAWKYGSEYLPSDPILKYPIRRNVLIYKTPKLTIPVHLYNWKFDQLRRHKIPHDHYAPLFFGISARQLQNRDKRAVVRRDGVLYISKLPKPLIDTLNTLNRRVLY